MLWHAYPLGLLGADQTGRDRTQRGRLRDLVDWLPHVTSLGADTMLLGPVFSSLSHGYDTVTHREIDDRIGSLDDLEVLIEAAHRQGIGILLDGVFAYASRAFWRLSEPAESHAPWFRRDAAGNLVPWQVDSLVTPADEAVGYREYVAEVMVTWLDRGVAGWRLDSSWSMPAAFWRPVLARVRAVHPDVWLLGQVFDDDLPAVTTAASYGSATEYALMHDLRAWLGGGPVAPMRDSLRRHRANSTSSPVHTFLGNHDVARLADVIDADLLPAAFAVLMTIPGVPGIYYGDDLGWTSSWAPGGSDALLRPPMAMTDTQVEDGTGAALLETLRRLGELRRDRPWLTTATMDSIVGRAGGLTYRTVGPDGQALSVWVNPTAHEVVLPSAVGQLLLATADDHGRSTVDLPPRSWAIFG